MPGLSSSICRMWVLRLAIIKCCLKRSAINLRLSTSRSADYPIFAPISHSTRTSRERRIMGAITACRGQPVTRASSSR